MKKRIGILLFVLFSTHSAFAVRITTLYEGILPVSSQSVSERNQLASQALAQVFVKVSGNNDILAHPKIKTSLASANNLMQEFSYTSMPRGSDNAKPYLLQLHFDEEGVNKILREAGAPIWGQNRPLILVWLDNEGPNHSPEMIGADSESRLPILFKQIADKRGIPVIFPAMDVEDMSQVSVNDVMVGAISKLMNAAKRYASDAILSGRIVQNANGYDTQWKLVMGADQWGWNVTGKTLPDIFAALISHVADTLAGRYATVISNTVQTNVDLKIVNITESDDFTEAMNYIKHLTPVANVQLMQVTGGEIMLNVSLRGTQTSFIQALSVGQKLTPVESEGKQLVYEWNH